MSTPRRVNWQTGTQPLSGESEKCALSTKNTPHHHTHPTRELVEIMSVLQGRTARARPGRAPLLMPSIQVLPESAPRSVQTHPRMDIGVHHRRALISSHLMSAQRGWARLGEQFRPRVRAQLRTFLTRRKVRKTPSPACSRELEEDAEEPWTGRKSWKAATKHESTICSTIRSELRS